MAQLAWIISHTEIVVEEDGNRNGAYMNQPMGSTPNALPSALELLVKDRVAARLVEMGNPPDGRHVQWQEEGSECATTLCTKCGFAQIETELGMDVEEFHVTELAEYAQPHRCSVCNAWTRFEMRHVNVEAFTGWVHRLVAEESGVPEEFWLYADAAMTTICLTPMRWLRPKGERDSVDYELFLNAVLDLDLLQS